MKQQPSQFYFKPKTGHNTNHSQVHQQPMHNTYSLPLMIRVSGPQSFIQVADPSTRTSWAAKVLLNVQLSREGGEGAHGMCGGGL